MDSDHDSRIRDSILGRIASNRHRKLSIKIKSLVGELRGEPVSRIRPSAIEAATKTLSSWGLTFTFPDGVSGNDYITISAGGPRPVGTA